MIDLSGSELFQRLNAVVLHVGDILDADVVLSAIVGALEEELALLAISGLSPDDTVQPPAEIYSLEQAILERLAAIVGEDNPLENEDVLAYLVAAFSALRLVRRAGLFMLSQREMQLRVWSQVQAAAKWLATQLIDAPEE